MNSAVKPPVLPSPGNPTPSNSTPTAINLNKTLSPTPTAIPTPSPTVNKPSPSSTPLNLGSTVSAAAKLATNNVTPYAAQPPSHPAPNIVSAHQNVPNAAHQQHPSAAATGQQAATAHQAHPQVAQDMQQASMQFNKQVNCSNPTVGGVIPAAVNMVQEKVQSVPLPATANASSVALSIAATAPPAAVQKPPVIPSIPASINIPTAPKTVSNGTAESPTAPKPTPKEEPPKVTPVKVTPEPKPVVKEPEVKPVEPPKKDIEPVKPATVTPTKPPVLSSTPTPPVQKPVETSAVPVPTPTKEPVQISNTPKPKTESPQKVTAPTPSPVKTPVTPGPTTTTPRSATKRKRDSTSKSPKVESPTKVAKTELVTPRSSHKPTPGTSGGKRVRMRTQPYQSPIPEIALITKLTAAASTPKTPARGTDDKLIAFYKNEFLAVRNAEGGFYVCQAVQNVYKTSARIRIRWLSNQDKTTDIYIPDFYDHTEFDCILTNLKLKKIEKGKFRLPKDELERTESILKRALDVEKGVVDSADELTEEHPDGLDLSLLRDEDQLQKKRRSPSKKAKKRKSNSSSTSATPPKKLTKTPKKTPAKPKPTPRKTSPVTIKKTTARTAAAEAAKVKAATPISKVAKTPGRKPGAASKKEKTVPPITISTKKDSPVAVISRSNRTSRRDGSGSLQTSPVVDAKKAKLIAKVAGRKATRAETPPPKPSEKKVIAERGTKSAKATTTARGTRTARGSSPAQTPPQTAASSRRSVAKRSSKK